MKIKKLFIAFVLGLGLTVAQVLALSIVEGWLLDDGRLPVARAAGFTVDITTDENDGSCSDGDCSLRDAIIIANTNGEADVITLGSGTYVLTITGTGENVAATGDLDITDVLTITGLGPDQTVIDASGLISDRVFDIRSGAGTVVISGVTIMGGDVTGRGGGIYNDDADLTLVNTVVASNTATDGGGVYVYNGSATLSGGQIVGNTANNGGGVYIYKGNATLSGGRILSNTANTFGGGVYINAGGMTLSEGQIASNTANSGGGVYINLASGVFTQTGGLVAHNVATGGGGGVYISSGRATLSGGDILGNDADFGAGVDVVNTNAFFIQTGGVISGNTAANRGGGVSVIYGSATLSGGAIISNTAGDDGGGLFVSSGTASLTLVNTTVSGNAAGDDGGGLYVSGGTVAITYTTVASNTAAGGGGEGIHQAGGTVALLDTIVAHNGAANCVGTLSSNGHNLDSGATCGFAASGDITDTDPLLGPLTEENGAWVHPLLEGSPAIDAGACVAGITTDQRGLPRPQGNGCDIGAYELLLVAPTGVAIGGPTEGVVGASYVFVATISPPTATLPLTYTWSPAPDGGQWTGVVTYTWSAGGSKTISVTVENVAGEVSSTHTIEIEHRIYLPLVSRNR